MVAKTGKLGPLAKVGKPPPGMRVKRPPQRRQWPITARETRGRQLRTVGPTDWREVQAWPRLEPLMGRSNISLPHRRVIWWLMNIKKMQPGTDFAIEVPLFGEFGQSLTILPDVMLFRAHPGGVLCGEVQGQHYHNKMFQRHHDELRRQRIMMAKIYGMPVVAVIFIWERDICQSDERRNAVCELFLQGVEVKW